MRNIKSKKAIHIVVNNKLLPLMLILCWIHISNAQGIGGISIPDGLPTVTPPSPTVAALMKFEEVPVNSYNGIPDINIPIYNITANGGINFEVKLGYHPANINANLAASDCGLGWSLFAGGTISRTVKGLPDEIYIPDKKLGIYRTVLQAGNNINRFYEISNNMDNGTLFSSANQETTFEYMWDVMLGGKLDTEHDLYQYNFMGYSGRFIVQKATNGQLEVVKLDKNPLKVVNYYDPTSLVPNYFEITDDKGIKYKFDVIETTSTSNFTNTVAQGSGNHNSVGTTGVSYRSAFHLSKIYDSSGILAVDLSYTNDGKKEMVSSRSTTYTRVLYEDISTLMNNLDASGFLPEFNPLSAQTSSTSQLTTIIRKLSRIKIIGQGRIHFTYTTGRPDSNILGASAAYKLSKITINTWKDSVQQKRYDFGYDSSNKLDIRMMLSSVKKYNKDNGFEYDYEMFYKSPNYVPNLLGKDYWGYINQRPIYMPNGRYRETSPEHCTSDVLEIMKLPTGGAIKYNFEGNTYSYIGDEMIANFDDNPDNWMHLEVSRTFSTITNNMTPFFELGGTAPQIVYFLANSSFANTATDWRFRIYKLTNGVNVQVGSIWSEMNHSLTLEPGVYSVSFDTPGVNLHMNPFYAGVTAYYKRKPLGTIFNPVHEKKYLYGGGIRIRSIQYYKDFNITDINNPVFVPEKQTNYSYSFFSDSYQSSGSLVYPRPVFKYVKQKRECMRAYAGIGGGGGVSDVGVFNKTDLIILTYDVETTTDNLAAVKTKGSEVGYKNVVVTETGNGWKELSYTSAIDFPEQITEFNTQYPFLPTENIDHKRGNLLSSKSFDELGRIIDETVNTYDYSTDSGILDTGIRFYYPGDYQFINYFDFPNYTAYKNYLTTCTAAVNCFCTFGQPYNFITFARVKESFGNALLIASLTKQYFYENDSNIPLVPLQESTVYTYDPYNKKLSTQESTNALGEVFRTEYYYAKNLPGEPNALTMASKNMISFPLKVINYKNSEKLSEQKIVYKDWGNNLIAPELIHTGKGIGELEVRVRYNKMDNTSGNPLEVQQECGMKICYIWGYNKTQPVAKIENISYTDIPAGLITAIETASNASVTGLESNLVVALDNLRNASELSGAFVTTMTYMPQVGVRVVTDPRGNKTTFLYDSFGRLELVKDHEGKLLSQHSYNYRP